MMALQADVHPEPRSATYLKIGSLQMEQRRRGCTGVGWALNVVPSVLMRGGEDTERHRGKATCR